MTLENPKCLIGHTPSSGGFSIVMLVFRGGYYITKSSAPSGDIFFTQTLERQVTSHLSENDINTPET